MDLYIGHNRPPFVEFGAELLPDFILRKDPNRCSEVRPRCSEPRTGSNALKRGQGALNAGRGDLNVRNNHHFVFGQQSERRIRQADSQERLSPDSEKTLGWPALVARLFCRELWRSAYLCSAAVYRSSTNAQLKAKIPVMVRLISPP